jgi:hypothetical protein
VRATRPARLLVALVGILDRYWGPLGLGVVVLLEVFVFAPRGDQMATLVAGIVGAGLMVGWLGPGSGLRL